MSANDALEVTEQRLRGATERVEWNLEGRPPWTMSRAEALHLAGLAADYLRARGAVKVHLFGSVARGRALGVHSDFDFAVEGFAPAAFLGSLGTLLQLLPLPVDLVDLESAPPALRDRINSEGIPL